MENKPLILQQRLLTNPYKQPLTLKSLDFPELNNTVLLANYSQPLSFMFPPSLKLKEDVYTDSKGKPCIFFMLVDKDY
jgi:hypothetical protein